MGMVYEATHLALGRRVAVKVIAPQLAHDPEFRERFEREARLTARLHHPHVVDVYDAGEQDGVLYLVMRFVEGTDLRTLLHGGQRLDAERAVALTGQVAGALDAAHAAGLIHRDVTPSNILIGDGGDAALTDFGLVKHLETAGLTRTGAWFGTLAYVAPEALRDEGVDARADVYALGCLLHRMLTGETPYPRESDAAVIAAHLHDAPPRPSVVAGVPSAFDGVIARALAKEPQDRFGSAGALAVAARDALRATPDEAATGTAPTIRRTIVPAEAATRIAPPHKHPAGADAPARTGRGGGRLAVAAAALLLLGAGAGAALGAALQDDPAPAPKRVRTATRASNIPAPANLTPYETVGYRAQVPDGWELVADDMPRGTLHESRWRTGGTDPAELVIAYVEDSQATPEGAASRARAQHYRAPTFSELAFGPVGLAGGQGYRWIYGTAGDAHFNWYLNPCGIAVAVHGQTAARSALYWAPTFRTVAESIQTACE